MIDRSDRFWYKNAVIYELHIKAFFDANNDGIGDFAGLFQKLDYLQELGVTAIWLLPFYPSPLRDDGYDISDYVSINPSYGTMRDFRQFVAAAHARDMRVITELVVNHTSDQHPWFQRARHAKPGSKWRDYYVWSDTDKKYRDTRIIFLDTETSNWTWDPVAKAYYWHRFYSHQPDLNYDNPRVFVDILRVMRFWLDMGVDGLRLDAVPYLIERDGTNNENLPETHEILKRLRAEIEERYPDRMLLAEANQWPEETRPYFGDGDECHMAFHFPLMPRIYMSIAREDRYPITDIIGQTPPIPDNCQWAIFLRNHDELTLEMVTDSERDYLWQTYATDARARLNLGIRRRLAPLMDNDRRKIELLNGLLLSMPGTPVIYYGDELGMGDNFYLGDRDGVRTPMQWSADRNGGFSRADPQQLFLPPIMDPIYGYEIVNVESQQKHASSLLNWIKRMLAVRQTHNAFGHGNFNMLRPQNRKILAYLREYEGEQVLCVFNLSRQAQAVELDLSEFKGKVPVEMTGQSAFPPVGTLPYMLTLPAYGFFWFILAEAPALPAWHEPVPEPLPELETLVLGAGWSLVESQRGDRKRIERFGRELLPAYIGNQRWFRPRDHRIIAAKPIRLGELKREGGDNFLLLALEVELENGEQQLYLLPLAIEWGEQNLRPGSRYLSHVLAKVRRGPRAGVVQEATTTPDFAGTMLLAMRNGTELIQAESKIRFERLPELESLQIEEGAPQRSISGYGSTFSTIGDDAVVKLYRRLRGGIQPEIEIGRFLAQSAFQNTSKLLGFAEHIDANGTTTALAAAFREVPNQGDGWTVVVNALDRELEEASLAGRPSDQAESGIAYSLSLIEVTGRRTGELHRALAQGMGESFAPERVTRADLELWRNQAFDQIDRSLELLASARSWLDQETRVYAEQLLKSRARLRDILAALLPKTFKGHKMRLHGDFHLGRILVAENDIYITGFEGELDKPLEELRQKAPPTRDIASMLRSFDYAARNAVDRQRQRSVSHLDDVKKLAAEWRRTAERIFLSAYSSEFNSEPVFGEGTLGKFFLANKLIYEIGYEVADRPDWISVPVKAAVELLAPEREAQQEETVV